MPDRIELREISARGVIGLGEPERRQPQEILISAALEADLSRAGETDRVEDSLNYSTLSRRIIGFVECSRFHTLEALAARLVRICLAEPLVERASVRVEKPAAERAARSIAVEMTRSQAGGAPRRDAFVVLGSNLEPETMLRAATFKLCAVGLVTARSAVYQSSPVDSTSTRDYLNAAVRVQTTQSPAELHRELKLIEAELGRTHNSDGVVAIDLDLCLLESEIFSTADLELPSPELLSRAYAAATIAEIAPERSHPVTREPLAQIATRLLARSAGLIRRDDVVLPEV